MFASKLSRIVPIQHNLHFFIIKSNSREFSHCYSIYFKNIKVQSNIYKWTERIKIVCKNSVVNQSRNLKGYSTNLFALCTRQFEFVIAQRIRRGQQMFTLYSKLWEERAFKEMLRRMRQQFIRRSKSLILSSTGLTFCNWSQIKDEDFYDHFDELDFIKKLTSEQLTCSVCKKRLKIDTIMPKVNYCECPDQPHTVKEKFNGKPIPKHEWEPFIERKDTIVWRRECSVGKYAYKVHGIYNDVSANDYLQVQIDIEYRKNWDESAVELQIVENDEKSHSDLVYWEMKWPRFFSNRDYVFGRRYYLDEKNKIIVLISQSTTHPSCPVKKNTIRVTKYWSVLVIRPLNEFNEQGIEFSLTYFDDPGVTLPDAMTTWVAVTGMPNFMLKMRCAARGYKKYLQKKESETSETVEKVIHEIGKGVDDDDDMEETDIYDDNKPDTALVSTIPTVQSERIGTIIRNGKKNEEYEQIDPLDNELSKLNVSNDNSPGDSSFWRYLRPLYFF